MADTQYAWSRILYGVETDSDGNVTGPKAFEPGDEVTQDGLGVSDEDWQMLQDQEVVRPYPLSEDLRSQFRSPRQLMQDKLIAAQQGFDISGPTADLVKRFDSEDAPKEVDKNTGEESDAPDPNAPPQADTPQTP